ncbi:ATP-dependent (S)-NAD(P)H-hydrate dehydratase isoform X2 [Benincasa hispida]|uniref:ATP-dependent (S)-NAD(P)H-hydrate dehydratase isoform X2 n=1 Tax=Benincasa hispida TaxID=102211 RepID=UPI0018FF6CF5|nr:ATP-dependent (S)-NAD(P)H-hydrate dehydratase isoform X2 [Benincasa hispida]
MLASSAVFRRQQFLIRSLGGFGDCTYQNKRQQIKAMSGGYIEADAANILRAITPSLDPNRYKGQAGKIAVIGGCREYTVFSFQGADLSHVFCTKDAAPVIKSYSPELIVHPVLEESYSVRDEEKKFIAERVLAEVDKWLERFDCLVIGPGLGRDPFLLDCVSEIIRHARQNNIPMVIDGDGLFLITDNLHLVSNYPLAVLTPNVNEYKRLVKNVLLAEVDEQDAPNQLLSLAKRIGGLTILRKGRADLISDGETVKSVSIYGSPRRCGGQGDILSGSVAVFVSWAQRQGFVTDGNLATSLKNPTVLGCIAGSALLRRAASLAFENKKRSTLTTDIIEFLWRSLEDISPAH